LDRRDGKAGERAGFFPKSCLLPTEQNGNPTIGNPRWTVPAWWPKSSINSGAKKIIIQKFRQAQNNVRLVTVIAALTYVKTSRACFRP